MTNAAGRGSDGLGLDGLDLDGLEPDGVDDVPDDHARGPSDPWPEPPSGWPDTDLDQSGRPRVPSRGGRPTLYTLPRVLSILAALFDGSSRAEAARRAGVGVSTFYVWLQLGRAGHPAFAPLAEAAASVEDARGLNTAFKHLIRRRRFWKAFP
jgi:hypothetical protein